ncbi:alpha-amylase family glycosyl hydrolase [Thermoflexus sp.]|uniref:alpha-amylase family glycosyl hydrolase n=1 Tax=Thermoflexus sp. TaxID=1969742 RepID=UPI002ADD821D|nr:alpha-amylase family glycosyl hydrolase [Thermoflexus sp.]
MRGIRWSFIVLLILVNGACRPIAPPVPSPALPTPVPTETIRPAPTPTFTLPPYTTPAWFRSAVLYEIFLRSFYDSDGDGVGDLRGIIARLDYLQSLGVTAIWLTPIHPSPSDHGYDVMDYFHVRPEYGTVEDVRALAEAAHARGMRVLLDFVSSHLSNQHPYFRDAFGNPASRYSDWFIWQNEAHTRYLSFDGVLAMPRFNHYNPEVVAYLTQVARFWLSQGIDGFRVDNATFPPKAFFVALRREVKAVNPDALLLGEFWVRSVSRLAPAFPDQFDALFDFPLYHIMLGDPNRNGDGVLSGQSDPVLLSTLFREEAQLFPPQSLAVRFLSNHDTNRLATELNRDPARLRLAAAFLTALPGPIMIYYGEEIGMLGQKGGPPAWDNYRREPMDWYASGEGPGQTTWFRPPDRWNRPGDGISVEEEEQDPSSLLNTYRRLLRLRAETPALREGDFTVLELTASAPGAWGFVRRAAGQTVVALFNFSDQPLSVTLSAFPFTASAPQDLLNGRAFPPTQAGQPYAISMPGASAVWLVSPPGE